MGDFAGDAEKHPRRREYGVTGRLLKKTEQVATPGPAVLRRAPEAAEATKAREVSVLVHHLHRSCTCAQCAFSSTNAADDGGFLAD